MTTYRSRRWIETDTANAFDAVTRSIRRLAWCDPDWGERWPSATAKRGLGFEATRLWRGRTLAMRGSVIALVHGARFGLRLEHEAVAIAMLYDVAGASGKSSVALTYEVEARGGSMRDSEIRSDGRFFEAEIELHIDRLATYLEGGDPSEVVARPSVLLATPSAWADSRRAVEGKTFAELGLDLPRYAAKVGTTDRYVGPAWCQVSGEKREHAFVVDGIQAACPTCAARVYRTMEREQCPLCHGVLLPLRGRRLLVAGYDAVVSGLAVFAFPTEAGPLTANTTSLPGATPAMRSLAATPAFRSWGDAPWLLHCDDAMIYLGQEAESHRLAPMPPTGLVHRFRCLHCRQERRLRESPEESDG